MLFRSDDLVIDILHDLCMDMKPRSFEERGCAVCGQLTNVVDLLPFSSEDASLDPLSSQDDTVTGLEAGAVAGAVAEAPPASATPSKPRMRRLKPSRTASTPVKAKPVAGQSAMVMEGGTQTATVTDKKPKSSTSVKRQVSRIATPAKPKRKIGRAHV